MAPVPRGGGIALAIGTLMGVLAYPWTSRSQWLAITLAAVLFGAVGLAEDLIGLPVLPTRLLLQVGAAVVATPFFMAEFDVVGLARGLLAAGVILALLTYVNAYKFMDGIDGISVAQALVAGVAFGLLGEYRSIETLAAGGAIIAAATLGFAPYNFPRARVFLGDSGSYFVGAVLAGMALVGVSEGLPPEAVSARWRSIWPTRASRSSPGSAAEPGGTRRTGSTSTSASCASAGATPARPDWWPASSSPAVASAP